METCAAHIHRDRRRSSQAARVERALKAKRLDRRIAHQHLASRNDTTVKYSINRAQHRMRLSALANELYNRSRMATMKNME